MNSWVRALVADASSTRATMRATTESFAARFTLIRRAPVPFSVPANTSSPISFATGSGSPVIEAWSTSLRPSSTSPSAPTRSPGRTSTMSPTTRSAVSISSSSPYPLSRVARSGARSSSARTESAVRRVTKASSAPEVAKMTMSRAPSKTCPIDAASRAATIMRMSTSRVFARSARSPETAGSQPPVT
jgi:hypothetical protein